MCSQMKTVKILSFVFFLAFGAVQVQAQRIVIPDLKEYKTLQCDFHIHTVFSDGTVWPTVRIDEAYREGLDAISITEHIYPVTSRRVYLQEIESQSNLSLKGISHNISYKLAKSLAKERNIILIRGSEITCNTSPWHSNAIFLDNSDELDKPEWMDSFRAAKAQNAFFFWNHPGREKDQPDTTLWWPEHTRLLQEGMMQGIEVVNGGSQGYSADAHRWALEKKLTFLGNSDIHAPMPPFAPGQHRVMTLVFAKERTAEAIHEALRERRTAIYYEDFIIGEETYLKQLFESTLEWKIDKTDDGVLVTVRNKSDLTFRLKKTGSDARLVYFRNTAIIPFTIVPNSERSFTVRLNDGITGGDINFSVENFMVEPNKGMRYSVKIN